MTVPSEQPTNGPYRLEEAETILRGLFERERATLNEKDNISSASNNPQFSSALRGFDRSELPHLEDRLHRVRRSITGVFESLVRYPPTHQRHFDHLANFLSDGNGTVDNAVFIMTKFPDRPSGSKNRQLEKVIDTVTSAVRGCGLDPRIASARDYHAMLWDNVELYLLGCSRGIAIVEDKYCPELNPNVAMEWGWMRALGRSVLFLVEREFSHFRADWSGLIKKKFTWSEPENDIPSAVTRWIEGRTV